MVALVLSFADRPRRAACGDLLRQAPAGRRAPVLGRGHARRHRSSSPSCSGATAWCPTSGSPGPTTSSAGAPTSPRRLELPLPATRASSSTSCRSRVNYETVDHIVAVAHLRRLPRRAHRASGRSGRTGARRKPASSSTSDVRPTAGEAGVGHRRWPAPTPTRRCRSSETTTSSRRSTPTTCQGGQAQAVHPHRPVRVHHVRGLRRHLPVEVHPHGAPRRDRRGRAAPSARASTRPTTSIFIIDDDVCTRCALCVDRCPTGVIILGKVGDPAADGDRHQRTNTHGYGYGMRLG